MTLSLVRVFRGLVITTSWEETAELAIEEPIITLKVVKSMTFIERIE
jgi:hypothetical protein